MERPVPVRTGKTRSSEVPCRFHAQGNCTRGARSPYLHDEEHQVRAPSTTSPLLPPLTMSKPTRPCLFFAQGACKRGVDCIFSHENGPVTAPPSTASHPEGSGQGEHTRIDSRSQVQCAFLARGSCVKGAKCAFAHCGNVEIVRAKADASEVRSHYSSSPALLAPLIMGHR